MRCSSTSARTTAPRRKDVINRLHIANGHTVTDTLRTTPLGGDVAIWADPLHDGPVPGDIDDDALLQRRAAFLAESYGLDAAAIADGLTSWRRIVDRSAEYDEVVLWYEHDLFDQLNLLQLLDRLGALAPRPQVSLVSIDRFPGRARFRGLGELSAEQLTALFAERSAITEPQYRLASAAWRAFRSPAPRAIEPFAAAGSSPLPFLPAALRRHLEDFPDIAGGLSRTERTLLQVVDDAPANARDLFAHISDGETAFFIADTSFWAVVRGLGNLTPPLLRIASRQADAAAIPDATLTLTDAGRRVLHGDDDRVRQYGIDIWRGGTHLVGRGPVWRWSPDDERLVVA